METSGEQQVGVGDGLTVEPAGVPRDERERWGAGCVDQRRRSPECHQERVT